MANVRISELEPEDVQTGIGGGYKVIVAAVTDGTVDLGGPV